MRNHYVPRFYLRGFSLPEADGQVWTYDKTEGKSFRASVANVAVSKDFYDEEDEVELSQSVEEPGNSVLAKIRDRKLISSEEKAAFSVYLGALLMRVPERRKRSLRSLPSVVDQTIDRVYEGILALSEEKDADQDLVTTRLEQVESAREQFKKEPPPKLVKQMRSPWPSRDVVCAIYSMRWRFGITEGPQFLLTSDNPVFFFESYGLASEESELTFPISKKLVLYADRQQNQFGEPPFVALPPSFVKEANRRLASQATRFVFSHKEEPWIGRVVEKRRPYLSRISWG